MTIKRIGEHVFKQHEWTEEQLTAARRIFPDFQPFDITLMCGVDSMDYVFDTFGIDVFDWCDQQMTAKRPGFARIMEVLQYVPEGGEKRTRREIIANWISYHGDVFDSPEYLSTIFDAFNSVTGVDWHKRYAEALAPGIEEAAKKASKKKPVKTT